MPSPVAVSTKADVLTQLHTGYLAAILVVTSSFVLDTTLLMIIVPLAT